MKLVICGIMNTVLLYTDRVNLWQLSCVIYWESIFAALLQSMWIIIECLAQQNSSSWLYFLDSWLWWSWKYLTCCNYFCLFCCHCIFNLSPFIVQISLSLQVLNHANGVPLPELKLLSYLCPIASHRNSPLVESFALEWNTKHSCYAFTVDPSPPKRASPR